MTARLRIGLFPFLNVQPLVHGLRDQSDFELTLDLPSRIADRFRRGELDLAMVPSLDAATMEARVVDSLCISSDGPVETVILHHRVPLAQVKSLALDEASRTSAALSKILIDEASGRLPQTTSFSPKLEDLPASDAILVIGDPAFRFSRPGFDPLDLGEEWKRRFDLPFVFALMMAGPRAQGLDGIGARLKEAATRGLAAASSIATSYNSGVDPARAEHYLRSVIHYDLGPREKEGLFRFYSLARMHGLLADLKELSFHAI